MVECKQAIRVLNEHVSEKDLLTTIYEPRVKPLLVLISNFLFEKVLNERISVLYEPLTFNQQDMNNIVPKRWDKYLQIQPDDVCYDILQKGLRIIKHLSKDAMNDIPLLRPLKKVNGIVVSNYKPAKTLYDAHGNKPLPIHHDDVLEVMKTKQIREIKKRMSLSEINATGGRDILSNVFKLPGYDSSFDAMIESTMFVYNECEVITIYVSETMQRVYKKNKITAYRVNGRLYDRYGLPITEDGTFIQGMPVLWSFVKFDSSVKHGIVIDTHVGKTVVPLSKGNRLILPDGKVTGRPTSLLFRGYGNVVDVVNGYLTLNKSIQSIETHMGKTEVEYITCSPSRQGSKIYLTNKFVSLQEFASNSYSKLFTYKPPRTTGLSLFCNELGTKLYTLLGIVNTSFSIMPPKLLNEIRTPKGNILSFNDERYANISKEKYTQTIQGLTKILGIIPNEGISFNEALILISIIHGVPDSSTPPTSLLFESCRLSTAVSFTNRISAQAVITIPNELESTRLINGVIPHVDFISLTVSDEYHNACSTNPEHIRFINRMSIAYKYNQISLFDYKRMKDISKGLISKDEYVNTYEVNTVVEDAYWTEYIPNVSFDVHVSGYVGEDDDVLSKKEYTKNFRYIFADSCINTVPYDFDIVYFNEFNNKPFVRYLTDERLDIIFENNVCQLCINRFGELVILYENTLFVEYNGYIALSDGTPYGTQSKAGFLPFTNERLSLQHGGINVEPYTDQSYVYDIGLMDVNNINEIDLNVGLAKPDEEDSVIDFINGIIANLVEDEHSTLDTADMVKLIYEELEDM